MRTSPPQKGQNDGRQHTRGHPRPEDKAEARPVGWAVAAGGASADPGAAALEGIINSICSG
jgi:hypothetical protein